MKHLLALAIGTVAIGAVAAGCGGKVIFESSGGDDGAGAAGTAASSATHANSAVGVTNGPTTGDVNPLTSSVVAVSSSTGLQPITCGNSSCDTASEECCTTMQDAHCVPNGGQCQGFVLHCSSAAQCPGQVCCASFGGGQNESVCQNDCGGGPQGGVQLCETSDECLHNEPCNEGPNGLSFCGGFGGGNGPNGGGG